MYSVAGRKTVKILRIRCHTTRDNYRLSVSRCGPILLTAEYQPVRRL